MSLEIQPETTSTIETLILREYAPRTAEQIREDMIHNALGAEAIEEVASMALSPAVVRYVPYYVPTPEL